MNLSLCGCGFLGIYHLGVAKALITHGRGFLSQVNQISGSSAGALIASVILCAPHLVEECKEFNLSLSVKTSTKPLGALTPGFSILDPLQTFLERSLPTNSYQKASGVLHITLTNVQTKENEIFNEFTSDQELIQCLMATCFIPVYCGFKPPVIRGKKYVDGGLTNNLYIFKHGRTVTVSPFAGKQDICPQDKPGKSLYMNVANIDVQLNKNNFIRCRHALFPPSRDVLLRYYERGTLDAVRFLKKEKWYDNDSMAASPGPRVTLVNGLKTEKVDRSKTENVTKTETWLVSETCTKCISKTNSVHCADPDVHVVHPKDSNITHSGECNTETL